MKEKRKGLFSFEMKDNEYFKDKPDKIDLVSCELNGKFCKKQLSLINDDLLKSREYLLNKDYVKSIESLKTAYYITTDINENTCLNCANLFRSTVIQSLEEIHEDLRKMTSSWIWRKRYQESFEMAGAVLQELKKGN